MSDWSYYLDDPQWRAAYKYAMGPMNKTIFPRWIQGSVGGTTPMQLESSEYDYIYMKHGSNTGINAYDGGLRPFSSAVTPQLQGQVKQCGLATMNPAGCQMAAVRQIYSDVTLTPHPFRISYATGRSPYTVPEKPTGRTI